MCTPSVSLTRSGLPRIIPSFHLWIIASDDPRAASVIQLYMSLFSVSKLIALAPRVRKKLFELVITPPSDIYSIKEVASEMREHLPRLIMRYVPAIRRYPLDQGMSFVPTWKSVPSTSWFVKLLKRELLIKTANLFVGLLADPYLAVSFQN